MRFLIGLLLGLGLGFVVAILFAPERPKREEQPWQAPPEEEPEAEVYGNHDLMGGLRRALHSLQLQAQEAWTEALSAAEEAEREMWDRYRTARRRKAAAGRR